MLDYRGLEAFDAIISQQSFEKAAKLLHLTQSAVSQRLKALENFYGAPLMSRSVPYTPTGVGSELLVHYKKVMHLENELMASKEASSSFSLALNRDSLETWFLEVLCGLKWLKSCPITLVAEDQKKTLKSLKKGEVLACISSQKEALKGCFSTHLVDMTYCLVVSSSLVSSHQLKRQGLKALKDIPFLKYDLDDDLHEEYFQFHFNQSTDALKKHIVPSVRGFKAFVEKGLGFALIPLIDIYKELNSKKIIECFPLKRWSVPLYWHYWDMDTSFCRKINQQFIEAILNHFKKVVSF